MFRSVSDDRLAGVLYDPVGLNTVEVLARRARYGKNDILQPERNRWTGLAADTARDPMVWFLVATALLFAWLGDVLEALVLGLAIIPLVGMDAFLHWRTRASTDGLRRQLGSRAIAVREGVEVEVASTELVPGDLILVRAGEWAPADGLIEAGDKVQADESSLTGEAMPIGKRALTGDQIPVGGAPIGEERWLFAGARVLTGSARVRVAFTGADTIYGQIVRSVRVERREQTPMQKAIARLVTALLIAALAACAALAATRLVQGNGLVDALLSAVTLAVAALPEEFPVVFAFFLGVGVFRLAQRRALVRRAVAVENIGRVTCICSDKTGTLTEGRLRLEHLIAAPGYDSDALLHIAARASRAESADPLDLAILGRAPRVAEEIIIGTFPFTEDRRRETSVVRDQIGLTVSIKGAPETVLRLTDLSQAEIAEWLKRTEGLAAAAHKVIACAELQLKEWDGSEPGGCYDFAGLLAFEDPLREGAQLAVADARAAGIRVIMVTGDHIATARAVADALAIGDGQATIVDGEELLARIKSGGEDAVRDVDVVARATPAQKQALVEYLRSEGEIVAVTGDGVNDAPALRASDIGIAMGERGAQTSREVASIVLLDDSFDTIVRAIAEGRQLFRNLRLSFAYLLMVHGPLVATAAIIPFLGEPLLYLPAHIVWLELIFHPTALLAFQERPQDGGRRIGGKPAPGFFSGLEWAGIGGVALILTLAVFLCYQRALDTTLSAVYARSTALAVLVLSSAAIAAALSGLRTRSGIIVSAATALSVPALIQAPIVARVLNLTPLGGPDLAGAAGIAIGIGILVLALQGTVSGSSQQRETPSDHAPNA
ncbi:MAG: cation-translocating P-type ATPase [Hyphomonadaceae bacterium]